MIRTFCLLLLALTSCSGGGSGSHGHRAKLVQALEPFGIAPEVAATQVTPLAYTPPPSTCPHVLRISVVNEPDLLHEPDSESYLSIARDEIDAEPFNELRVMYRGFRAEKGVQRRGSMSTTTVGPTSPTAGCLPKTWDPVEDAMTLGWPELTGRLTSTEERWTGHRVAGKCNRSACVDPKTGGGGPENHHRTCVSQDWQNQLVGIYKHDGETLALIRGTWTDGHGDVGPVNTTGIWAERFTLLNVDHGRPMWSRHHLHHSFPQITADKSWAPVDRTWEMHTVDACPGSLAAHGWTRPTEVLAAVDDQLALQNDPATLKRAAPRRSATPSRPKEPDGGQPYIVPRASPDPKPGAVPPSEPMRPHASSNRSPAELGP